jgi:hypothetical protein
LASEISSFSSLNFFQLSQIKPADFSARAFQAIIKNFGSSLSRAEPGLTPSLNATIMQPRNATMIQPCNATITQHCNATITQPCKKQNCNVVVDLLDLEKQN